MQALEWRHAQTGINSCTAGFAVPKCKCSSLWSMPRCMGMSCQLLVGLPDVGSGDGCMRCAQTFAQWPNHAPDALKVYDALIAQAPNGEPLTSAHTSRPAPCACRSASSQSSLRPLSCSEETASGSAPPAYAVWALKVVARGGHARL